MPYMPPFNHACILSPEIAASLSRPSQHGITGSSSYPFKHRRSPAPNDTKEVLSNSQRAGEKSNFDPHGWPIPFPTRLTILVSKKKDPKAENLKELQIAISTIELRESSPNSTQDDGKVQVDTYDFAARAPLPLSEAARKISSSRSSTDSDIVFDAWAVQVAPPANFKQGSDGDNESDGTPISQLSMTRKKSGELVRPALRHLSKGRPSHMPGTPTCSKVVHFDSHLEYIQHFLQVDRPLAVSAGSFPIEQYGNEDEFPFGLDRSTSRSWAPLYKWEIKLANFPDQDIESRKGFSVYGKRIFLSSDNKTLIGSIAVQNLAFHKTVVSRFTLDYWETISEVVADYDYNIRQKQQNDGLDRFHFSIYLADQVRLEDRTMFFCIRYSVNGQDYWDSNNGRNYQVDFYKKIELQHGKKGIRDLDTHPFEALPYSRPSPPSTAQTLQDAPQIRSHEGSQNFRDRYDLDSSLTAAKNGTYALPDD